MYEIRKNDKNKIQEFLKEKFDIECKDIQLKRDGKIQNENEHHIKIEPIGVMFILYYKVNKKYKGPPPTYQHKDLYKAEVLYKEKKYDVPVDIGGAVADLWLAQEINRRKMNLQRV